MKSQFSKSVIFDLDGTLIKNDLLYETIIIFLLKSPLNLFLCFIHIFKGKAFFKDFIFRQTYEEIDINILPYRSKVIEYMQFRKNLNHKIYIASGSHHLLVDRISKKLGCDGFFASDQQTSLTGKEKTEVLKREFPDGFDYVGNSLVDIPVWRESNNSYLVSDSPFLIHKIKNKGLQNLEILPIDTSSFLLKIRTFFRLLRVKHYVKNLVFFMPLLLHYGIDFKYLFQYKFLSYVALMSLTSSIVYIFNDIVDIQSDRKNSLNKNRPLAQADISIKNAFFILLVILFVIILWAYYGSTPYFISYFLFYILLNILYSFSYKHILVLNSFILSLFFLARVVLGILVTNIELSPWLISCSFFFFYALANIKKIIQLKAKEDSSVEKDNVYFIFLLVTSLSSFYSSLTIFILFFIVDNQFFLKYTRPYLLFISYFAMFLFFKIILLESIKGDVKEDPVTYFLRRKDLFVLIIIIIVGVIYAK